MRLKSEVWVKAYLRRAQGEGASGYVTHRGDEDAGVILIKIAHLDGRADLFGPVPAGFQSDDGERRWVRLGETVEEAEVDRRIESELRLDPDSWVIEIEDRAGRHFLDDWLASGAD
ncbi:MAG: DUF1491 family protein [Hyphomicrobiaceae bacterium]